MRRFFDRFLNPDRAARPARAGVADPVPAVAPMAPEPFPEDQIPVTAERLFDMLTIGGLMAFEDMAHRWNGDPLEQLRNRVGNTLLHAAVDNDNVVEVFRLIPGLRAPEILNARSTLQEPALSAVQMAVSRGHLVSVRALRDAGAEMHGQGLLAIALREGAFGMAQYLMGLPDRPGAVPWDRDDQGVSALERAAQAGHVEIVRRLAREEHPQMRPEGAAGIHFEALGGALHQAALGRWPTSLATMDALLENGALVNGRGRDGLTPLQTAVIRGWVEGVHHLLARHGADARAVDGRGRSAIDLAIAHRDVNCRQQMVNSLIQAGATMPVAHYGAYLPGHAAGPRGAPFVAEGAGPAR